MQYLKRWIKFLLGFSRRETNGFLILVPLIMLILFSQPLYTTMFNPVPKDFTSESVRLDSLIALLDNPNDADGTTKKFDLRISFDPNTVALDQLKRIGFEVETAKKLIRYRERGGRFVVKSDVLKIYGMDSIFFNDIYQYIDLPVVREVPKSYKQVSAKSNTDSLLDLNLADSIALLKVYGIGPVLSARIVRFRDALGGFIKESQLHEVYGLDTVVVERLFRRCFITEAFKPRKININTCTEKELASHPYLSRSDASAIVTYRFQHGSFKSLEDIRNIQSIEEKTFIKIESYLTIDQ